MRLVIDHRLIATESGFTNRTPEWVVIKHLAVLRFRIDDVYQAVLRL
jgi:hypothetical protein